VAHDVVLLLFGPKWSAAVVPAELLSVYTAIHIPAIPTMPLLQVTGQASYPPRWGFVTLAALVPLFYAAGSRWGTVGIAGVWLSVYPILLTPVYARVFKTLGIGLRAYLSCVTPTLVAVAFMAVVVVLVRLSSVSWPLAVRCATEIASGVLAFVIAGFFCYRSRRAILADFLRTVSS